MSRVGKNPGAVPGGVDVTIAAGLLTAKGELGEQEVVITDDVTVERDGDEILVKPRNDSKRSRAMWGTVRTLVRNAVVGVSEGYTRRLEINGVGYRAQMQGKNLSLQLGYSHDISYPVPEGIKIALEGERGNVIAVSGSDKQREIGRASGRERVGKDVKISVDE